MADSRIKRSAPQDFERGLYFFLDDQLYTQVDTYNLEIVDIPDEVTESNLEDFKIQFKEILDKRLAEGRRHSTAITKIKQVNAILCKESVVPFDKFNLR